MENKTILEDGLAIISSCKKSTGDIWQAHLGAGAIASYYFARDSVSDGGIRELISSQANAMVATVLGENRQKHPATCDEESATEAILVALDRTIDQLHWVGHNVIYSAVSLLAIRELQGWGSTDDIAGITDLINSFERTIPGRSWIGTTAAEVKRTNITEEDRFPDITKPEDLSQLVLDEMAAFPHIYRAEAHHDLIGHMLTFSHALNILYDLGHVEFFMRGLPPVLKLVKALRCSRSVNPGDPVKLVSPVDRLPLHLSKRAEWLPTERECWEIDHAHVEWDFGHVFKFPFSFYDHWGRVERKESYLEKFRYIV